MRSVSRRRFLQTAGVAATAGLATRPAASAAPAAAGEQQIETCKQSVGLAHDLGARGVKVRPNGVPRNVPVEKTLEQIGKALVPCGQAAADAGAEIFVEVHGATTQLPANMKAIME